MTLKYCTKLQPTSEFYIFLRFAETSRHRDCIVYIIIPGNGSGPKQIKSGSLSQHFTITTLIQDLKFQD